MSGGARIINVERLELVEERLGVSLQGIHAEVKGPLSTGEWTLNVRGELLATSGGKLESSLEVKATAFNSAGDCVSVESRWFDSELFFGIDAFDLHSYLTSDDVQRIRIFVTKS